MLQCQHCEHRFCRDELEDVQLQELLHRAVLSFQCRACGRETGFKVPLNILQGSLRMDAEGNLYLVPGTLVNECQAEEMIKFEQQGPITTDEFIDFCRQLASDSLVSG